MCWEPACLGAGPITEFPSLFLLVNQGTLSKCTCSPSGCPPEPRASPSSLYLISFPLSPLDMWSEDGSPSLVFVNLDRLGTPSGVNGLLTVNLSARVSYLYVGFGGGISSAFSQSPTFSLQHVLHLSLDGLLPTLVPLVVCTKPWWLHHACSLQHFSSLQLPGVSLSKCKRFCAERQHWPR